MSIFYLQNVNLLLLLDLTLKFKVIVKSLVSLRKSVTCTHNEYRTISRKENKECLKHKLILWVI